MIATVLLGIVLVVNLGTAREAHASFGDNDKLVCQLIGEVV
jgi:hypothetical protein